MQEHNTIWLQPWCDGCEKHCTGLGEGRQWCRDDIWEDCQECGNKSVRYAIDPVTPRDLSDGLPHLNRNE